MSIAFMFGLIAAALAMCLLLLRQLQAKPWLESGTVLETAHGALLHSPKIVALGVLIAVITALFSLFGAAYHMRMNVPDWTHLPLPKLLWLNSALLALSSAALQRAWSTSERAAAHRAQMALRDLNTIRNALLLGGGFALAFIAGQLLAWRQLDGNGFFFACSPASAFFYLLTGLHGVHLLGGLVVWAGTTATLGRRDFLEHGERAGAALLNIKLCAIYWHYLLLVWLALFALFAFT